MAADKSRVLIELYVDDQGTVKIQNARAAVEELGQAGKKGFADSAASADDFASSLVKQLGIYALLTTAAYKLEQVLVGAFKGGIQAVDDFKLTTIGVAATLTDLGKDGIDSQKAYAHNIAYSKDMYNDLELAAAKHFASGKEMVNAWNILAQKGIVLKKEEIDDLGTIVDKIKLATQGQVQALQISQELRAMLSGQARATDQLAMMVKDRYGAAWKDIIEQHRQAGDLVHWLAQEFKGLIYASGDVQQTLTSQKTTLDTLLNQVGRAGLEGAYSDIVGVLQQMNSYLRDHREEVGGGIKQAWDGVKTTISLIADILAGLSKGITIPISLAISNPEVLAQLNFLKGKGTTLWGSQNSMGGPDQMIEDKNKYMDKVYAPQRENLQGWMKESGLSETKELSSQIKDGMGGIAKAIDLGVKEVKEAKARADMQLGGMGKLGKGLGASAKFDTDVGWLRDLPPNVKPPAPADGKGGGGGKGRDTTDSLENLIRQLQQETAKLAEGAFAGVEAGYEKTVAKIRKLAMDADQLKEAMSAADANRAAKEQKISDDLNKKFLAATHQTSALQITEDLKRIADVKGHVKEEGQAREIMYQHAVERSQKLALAENQQQKTYYDSLASSSILITDQVAWKEKSWELEKKISQAQLDQWFIGKDLTNSQKDSYREMLALTNAAKDYNQQRQKAVDLGTLEGWAIERAGEALKREKSTIKDALTGVEGFFTDAFGQGIQGALTKQNKSFKEVGATIVQSMVLELNKKSFAKIWGEVAKMKAGTPDKTSAAGGGLGGKDPAQELSGAAKLLSLSGLQLGLSAGGLLLSGIGIATNSQALVYAGAFLQMVSLAIQVYEMFTAATTTTELTGAAISLDMSAFALKSAAMALQSAAASLGGSGGGGLFSSIIGGVASIGGALLAPFTGGASLVAGSLIGVSNAYTPSAIGFHSGGMVAHEGLLVAHNGLANDERLVKVLTGEPILQRSAMDTYGRMGMSFDDLNNGRMPVLPLPVPVQGGDSGGNNGPIIQHHTTTHITVVTQDGKVLGKQTKRDIITLMKDKDVQREIGMRVH